MLEKFREGDINDEEFCQTVIDLFVNSVTVWDEPDDKFKITIAYNLTSIPQKTYRLSKDGRLSDYASNTPDGNAENKDNRGDGECDRLSVADRHQIDAQQRDSAACDAEFPFSLFQLNTASSLFVTFIVLAPLFFVN